MFKRVDVSANKLNAMKRVIFVNIVAEKKRIKEEEARKSMTADELQEKAKNDALVEKEKVVKAIEQKKVQLNNIEANLKEKQNEKHNLFMQLKVVLREEQKKKQAEMAEKKKKMEEERMAAAAKAQEEYKRREMILAGAGSTGAQQNPNAVNSPSTTQMVGRIPRRSSILNPRPAASPSPGMSPSTPSNVPYSRAASRPPVHSPYMRPAARAPYSPHVAPSPPMYGNSRPRSYMSAPRRSGPPQYGSNRPSGYDARGAPRYGGRPNMPHSHPHGTSAPPHSSHGPHGSLPPQGFHSGQQYASRDHPAANTNAPVARQTPSSHMDSTNNPPREPYNPSAYRGGRR